MALAIGDKLGPDEIIAPISGGMGEGCLEIEGQIGNQGGLPFRQVILSETAGPSSRGIGFS